MNLLVLPSHKSNENSVISRESGRDILCIFLTKIYSLKSLVVMEVDWI